MTDHRKFLRAEPPPGRRPRQVAAFVDPQLYALLYARAEADQTSMADTIRAALTLFLKGPDHG